MNGAVLPDPERSQVALIGVRQFDLLEPLPAVGRNLVGLKRAFTNPQLWGIPHSNCTIIEQPDSAAAVMSPLRRIARTATDTLIIYYAGHGLLDPTNDDFLLALPGSSVEHSDTSLNFEWIRRLIRHPDTKALQKVVILDCCYSARAMAGAMNANATLEARAQIDGACILAAAGETKVAVSPKNERFTAFTGELIATLEEGIAGGPAVLDVAQIYEHLHDKLGSKSRPLPHVGYRNRGNQIGLVRNQQFNVGTPLAENRTIARAARPTGSSAHTSGATGSSTANAKFGSWSRSSRTWLAVTGVTVALAVAFGLIKTLPDGSDSSANPPPSSNPSTRTAESSSASTSATFAPDTTMAKISKAGRVRIGIKFDQPLYGSKSNDGTLAGFEVEVGRLLARRLGVGDQAIEWWRLLANKENPQSDKIWSTWSSPRTQSQMHVSKSLDSPDHTTSLASN